MLIFFNGLLQRKLSINTDTCVKMCVEYFGKVQKNDVDVLLVFHKYFKVFIIILLRSSSAFLL